MARRFIFRLEPVLEQRERVERDHQLRVAALERERIELEDRLRSCQSRILEAKAELREHLSGGAVAAEQAVAGGGVAAAAPARLVSIAALRLQSHASLHLVARARQVVLELAGAHERLRHARVELAKATAARKAVTLLRERQLAEWKRALAKQEAGELDELMVMRHGRKDAHS